MHAAACCKPGSAAASGFQEGGVALAAAHHLWLGAGAVDDGGALGQAGASIHNKVQPCTV